jgi:hypothetical protein
MGLKKDGSWQPCGDFLCLNLISTAKLCGLRRKLDLKGYMQVPVAATGKPKTA